MRYRVLLLNVDTGSNHPKPYDRPVEMLTNNRADIETWAQETLRRVDRKRYPDAAVGVWETVETLIYQVGLPPEEKENQ